MVMSRDAVETLTKEVLLPSFAAEKVRLDQIDKWYQWQAENHPLPRTASKEVKHLLELSKTPWLGLVVTTCAQAMSVDGYRAPSEKENTVTGPWGTWLANDMDARQHALHRAVLGYGYAYTTILPGDDRAVIRPVSPRKGQAFYQDAVEDVWPDYFLRAYLGANKWRLVVMDEDTKFTLLCDADGDNMTLVDSEVHGVGYCPVVRYTNQSDLDGRSPGEVEPFIGVASRINKTTYDRMLAQHHTSWRVLTVAGLAEPEGDEDAKRVAKMRLRHDDLLIAEDPDTKFGALPGTPLDGFISAWSSDIRALVAVSQTPATTFGDLVNVSPDTLAAIRGPFTQKVGERKTYMGKSHRQTLRCAADVEGNAAAAADLEARVTWQDTDIRSIGQAVDALGKAATMLMIPPQALWAMIPGVTKIDVEEWKRMARDADPLVRLGRSLEDEDGVPAGTNLPDA